MFPAPSVPPSSANLWLEGFDRSAGGYVHFLCAKSPSEYNRVQPSPWFCPCVKRKSLLGATLNSPQIFFVGYNAVVVVFLIKCGVVWQSAHTLDSAHLVQYTPDCEVNVEQINKRICGVRFRLPVGNSISRDTPQPVVAHHTAKFSCCGQKLMWGPPSYFLAYFEAVNLICVFVKISLN